MKKETKSSYKLGKARLRVHKPALCTSAFSKLRLKCIGKKDGKNKIPKQNSDGEWLSPTIESEYSRIDEYMSKILDTLFRKNNELYVSAEYMIAKFEQKAFEYENLHKYLETKISNDEIIIVDSNSNLTASQLEMLKKKRKK